MARGAGKVATLPDIVRDLDKAATLEQLGERLVELTRPLGVQGVVVRLLPKGVGASPSRGDAESARPPYGLEMSGGLDCDALARLQQPMILCCCRDPARRRAAQITAIGDPLPALEAAPRAPCVNFPVLAVGEKLYGVSFCGDDLLLDPSALATLSFLARYAFLRIFQPHSPAHPKLTDRQREILQWAAEGKTDKEIAAILNVSEHTIDKYMRQCRESLAAPNRTAAIVRALRLGLIA